MPRFPMYSLLALLFFINPAAAACNLIMADVPALTACARTHELTITLQGEQIAVLQGQLERVLGLLDNDRRNYEKLSERLRELQLQIYLQSEKAKPGKK